MAAILVTGGTGFIGSHTAVALMEAGYRVVIVDNFSNSEAHILDRISDVANKQPAFYQVDCTSKESLDRIFRENQDIEGVIHFAAFKAVGESVEQPMKYYRNNLDSMMAVLESMTDNSIDRLVFSSSCTVYGQPDTIPVTEQTPPGQVGSPYGFTKLACEHMIADYSVPHPELQSVILRYFNPIGAHPSGKLGELPIGRPNNLVPYITQTAAGLRDELVIFGDDYPTGDGTCIRDFIHVMDLADAHVKALEWIGDESRENPGVFNLGVGEGQSVLKLVKSFEEMTGKSLKWRYGSRRSGDIPEIFANVEKAKEVLGWQARYSPQDALMDAWRWQQNLSSNE